MAESHIDANTYASGALTHGGINGDKKKKKRRKQQRKQGTEGDDE